MFTLSVGIIEYTGLELKEAMEMAIKLGQVGCDVDVVSEATGEIVLNIGPAFGAYVSDSLKYTL